MCHLCHRSDRHKITDLIGICYKCLTPSQSTIRFILPCRFKLGGVTKSIQGPCDFVTQIKAYNSKNRHDMPSQL